VFEALPDALLDLWDPAITRFALEWPHFVASLVMLTARRVVEAATEAAAMTAKQRKQSEFEQSLLACWFSHITGRFSDDISEDRSTVHTLVHCVVTACFPSRSQWTELVADKTIALAGPDLQSKLRGLRAVSVVAGSQAGRLLAKPKQHLSDDDAAARQQLSIDELESRVAELKRAAAERKQRQESTEIEPWSLVKLQSACPIGLLPPECVLPDLDLPLELDDADDAHPLSCYFVRFASNAACDGDDDDEQLQPIHTVDAAQPHPGDEAIDDDEEEEEEEEEKEEKKMEEEEYADKMQEISTPEAKRPRQIEEAEVGCTNGNVKTTATSGTSGDVVTRFEQLL